MALLHANNVVCYLPWNSFTEFTQGRAFTNVWGTAGTLAASFFPADPFVSGLYLSGGAGSRTYTNTSHNYPSPPSAFSPLTVAFWASGEAQNVDMRLGYGWSASDPRNTIGIKLTTSGVQVVGEASNTGIVSWATFDVPRPNPSFYVVRAVPSGGTHINAYLSVNGGAWQWAGAAGVSGWSPPSVTGNYNYLGLYILNTGGWESVIEEAVFWANAPEFTSQELNNLYQLAATRQATMDQYTEQFPPTTSASGTAPVSLRGYAIASGLCDLSVTGEDTEPEPPPPGEPVASGTCPLFGHGHIVTSGTSDLALLGSILSSGYAPFNVAGNAIESGTMSLLMNGFSPKPISSCPTLDPLASIQIGEDLIGIYQARIDALINQLGKNVLLEYDPIVTPCPNCYFDAEAKRSTGVYKPGGPISFPRGQKCPHCKGTGTTEEQVTKCIKCLLKWNPADYASYGISLVDPKGIVRTKGYLSDATAIERASTAIVNYDIQSTMRLRVRRLRGPVPVGLRQDRYCITFWELIDA